MKWMKNKLLDIAEALLRHKDTVPIILDSVRRLRDDDKFFLLNLAILTATTIILLDDN